MFLQRITVCPAVGKAGELRAVMEERIKHLQSKGERVGLSVDMFNPEGATYIALHQFADLAGLEKFRQQNAVDPAFLAYQQKVSGLISRPPAVSLTETLIPITR